MIALVLAAVLSGGAGSLTVSATVVCPYGTRPDGRCLRTPPRPATGAAEALVPAAPVATSGAGARVTVSTASDGRPAIVTVQH